jgi:uncharacterized membrane protein
MRTGRLTAFSDGVLAILLTIMVLELPKPTDATWAALAHEAGTPLLAYLLSFVYLGIYWNNHHHLFATVNHVSGAVLWANLNLLFWLSLVPYVTGWWSESGFQTVPSAAYGIVLLLDAVSFWVLQATILRAEGPDSTLARALGRDLKGKSSPAFYVLGIAGSFVHPIVGIVFYVAVALLWLIPDRRVERLFVNDRSADGDSAETAPGEAPSREP